MPFKDEWNKSQSLLNLEALDCPCWKISKQFLCKSTLPQSKCRNLNLSHSALEYREHLYELLRY